MNKMCLFSPFMVIFFFINIGCPRVFARMAVAFLYLLALQDINLTRFSLPRRRSWGSSAWEARQGLDSRPFRPDTSYGVIQWLCVHVWGLYQSEGLFSWCSCHLSSLYRGEELGGQPKT